LFITRETVATETPACFATSRIVTGTLASAVNVFRKRLHPTRRPVKNLRAVEVSHISGRPWKEAVFSCKAIAKPAARTWGKFCTRTA
jgi:hypothetical protein